MAIVNKNPEYFLTIAKEGNISRAADLLYVSQSYLSQYISKLEKSFEVKLLDRSKTPIELTEAGEVYVKYLQSSNQLYSKLMLDFDNLNQQRATTLNLGIAPWRASTLLPDILPSFTKENPNTNIYLHEHPARDLFDLISKNVIDIAIMNLPTAAQTEFNTEFIAHEKIMLIACKENPLTKTLKTQQAQKGDIDLEILKDECFILMQPGMSCAEWIYNYMENVQFSPEKRIITTSKATACNLVAQNMGFSFIPETGLHWSGKPQNMKIFDMRSNDLVMPLAVIYKKGTYLSSMARKFIDTAKDYYEENCPS